MSPPPDPFAIDTFITFETCETAMDIVMTLTNTPIGVVGRIGHDERVMTREQRREHRAEASRARETKAT